MSENEKLVPVGSDALFGCPFCGTTPELVHSDIEIKAGIKAAVECTNPECRTYGPDGSTADEAARKWNMRMDLFGMEGAKAAINTITRDLERKKLELALHGQELDTIRSIIIKGGTAAAVLKFLDTPNA